MKLLELPNELLFKIFQYFDEYEMINLYTVNKTFKLLGEEYVIRVPSKILKKGFSLRGYQYNVCKWMKNRSELSVNGIVGGVIGLEMGLGKTLCSITYCKLNNNENNKNKLPTLIICNKMQLSVWKTEIDKFFDNTKVLMYHKSLLNEDEYNSLNLSKLSKYEFIVTTYEVCMNTFKKVSGMRRVSSVGPSLLFTLEFPRIFTDESHRFRNGSSVTLRALCKLKSKEKWCITGTPLVNTPTDIQSLFTFCGLDTSVSPKEFVDVFSTRLNKCVITLSSKDVHMNLPPRKVIRMVDKLTPEEEMIYEGLKTQTCHVFFTTKNFMNILAMFTKLRQTCISPHIINDYVDNSSSRKKEKNIDPTQSTRIINATKLIRRITKKKKKVLVFCTFVSALKLLKKSIKNKYPRTEVMLIDGSTEMKERDHIIDRFQNTTKNNVLLMSYQIGALGYTLTNCSHIILLNTWWNNTVIKQAIARCHRFGQKEKVTVYSFEVKDSIERHMKEVCKNKSKINDEFMDGEKSGDTINKKTLGKILFSNKKY